MSAIIWVRIGMNVQKLIFSVLLVCGLMSVNAVCARADDISQPAPNISEVNEEETLSDFIQQAQGQERENEAITEDAEAEKKETGNWISDWVKKGSQALNSKPKTVVPVKRSNASVFDISGIMLRMDRPQVEDAMQKRGYKRVSAVMEIPNFIRWRYEELCRNNNIVGYERLNNCVTTLAKKNNYQFVEQLMFSNFHTKETIHVYFTSNFTGNKVYRVEYQTEAANIKGSGAKAEYLRNLKIFDFWKKINQKYGVPDNKTQVIWGLGENKPSLQASTGRLVLNDPMLLELDYSRMAREDQKFMNTAVYTF